MKKQVLRVNTLNLIIAFLGLLLNGLHSYAQTKLYWAATTGQERSFQKKGKKVVNSSNINKGIKQELNDTSSVDLEVILLPGRFEMVQCLELASISRNLIFKALQPKTVFLSGEDSLK